MVKNVNIYTTSTIETNQLKLCFQPYDYRWENGSAFEYSFNP